MAPTRRPWRLALIISQVPQKDRAHDGEHFYLGTLKSLCLEPSPVFLRRGYGYEYGYGYDLGSPVLRRNGALRR